MASASLLDKLEKFFTQKPKGCETGTPPRWATILQPYLFLQPSERFPRYVYLRLTVFVGVSLALLFVAGLLAPIIYYWHKYPWFFTAPKHHKALIGLLSSAGYYQDVFVVLSILAFPHAIHLPYYYFWNRRAARLQANPVVGEQQTTPADNPSVWPPPPRGTMC